MNQDEYIKEIAKYKDQIREIESQGRQQGNTSMYYTTEDFKELIESGKMPKELGDWYLQYIDEKNQKFKRWQKFLADNPNMSEEDKWTHFYGPARTLSLEESLKTYAEMANLGHIHNIMWGLKSANLVKQADPQEILESNIQLFKNIDHDDNFGISYGNANVMYYLSGLIDNEPLHEYADNWKAKGSTVDSYGRKINLEYDFKASSKEDAVRVVKEYKDMMTTKGIQTWMAYWKIANVSGRPEFTCPLIAIMKCLSIETRKNRFDPEERQRFWNITKTLQKTRISMERYVRTDAKGKKIMQWIEQPLIEILGGEKEEEASEKYPLTISVRIRSAQLGSKEFAPALYKNEILKLNPNDAYLAFALSTRYGQKKESSDFDWDYIFGLGGLQGTAKTNPREAKIKARKKLTRLKKANILDGIKENGNKVRPIIKPFQTKPPVG